MYMLSDNSKIIIRNISVFSDLINKLKKKKSTNFINDQKFFNIYLKINADFYLMKEEQMEFYVIHGYT